MLEGGILSKCVLWNNTYGYGVLMWCSRGFDNLVILFSSLKVQSRTSCCFKYVLHVSTKGLIVTINV